MKKNVAVVFLLLIFTSNIFCEDESYNDILPEKYAEDEFPDPLIKIRRAEIIFAGSYPFSLLFTKIGYDLGEYAASGFARSYAPQIFGGEADTSSTNEETKKILITALYVSGAFTLIDYIIGEIKQKKAEKDERRNNSY